MKIAYDVVKVISQCHMNISGARCTVQWMIQLHPVFEEKNIQGQFIVKMISVILRTQHRHNTLGTRERNDTRLNVQSACVRPNRLYVWRAINTILSSKCRKIVCEFYFCVQKFTLDDKMDFHNLNFGNVLQLKLWNRIKKSKSLEWSIH